MAGRSGRIGVLGRDEARSSPPHIYTFDHDPLDDHDDHDDDPPSSPQSSPSRTNTLPTGDGADGDNPVGGRGTLRDGSPNVVVVGGGGSGANNAAAATTSGQPQRPQIKDDDKAAVSAANIIPTGNADGGTGGPGRVGTRSAARRSSSSVGSGAGARSGIGGGGVASSSTAAPIVASSSSSSSSSVPTTAANATNSADIDRQQQQQPLHLPPHHIPYHGTGGCLTCGADDDHANLMLCERCSDEYHTYCLDPPLQSVPEGDWFCGKCKAFQMHDADDGLHALVSALPPTFTSRFGEIVWAAGGVGFGWWPACIYDPRLTVGTARQLARRNLGKKHLVYFFECNDAPFTVLGNAKLCPWEEGLLEEYDLGKTARNAGKNKAIMFDQALQAALMEVDKPMDMRMEWNHHGHHHHPHAAAAPTPLSGQRLARQVQQAYGSALGKRTAAAAAAAAAASPLGADGQGQASSQGGKGKQRRRQSGGGGNGNGNGNGESEGSARRSGRMSRQPSRLEGEAADGGGGAGPTGGAGAGRVATPAAAPPPSSSQSRRRGGGNRRVVTVKRTNIDAALRAQSGHRAGVDAEAGGAIEIEPAEVVDGKLFCKILRKLHPPAAAAPAPPDGWGQRQQQQQQQQPPPLVPSGVGFVVLPSRRSSTFADLRLTMESDLDAGSIPPGGDWRFYVPKLGPVGLRQEAKLGPVLDFLRGTTADERLGDGSSWNPLKIIVADCSAGG